MVAVKLRNVQGQNLTYKCSLVQGWCPTIFWYSVDEN